ncbi:helix-turn-helix domain-containing protein [Lysinibacillus xylanilyticus]|uniref:helix-turn-helix domain-containing protein n=1 Tax=Lysinibacillus xylanilyticus TaxID=582475 RepID=UPI00380B89C7
MSLTSKKLHIHRNTLKYRLAKFQETTNISTKNIDGAILVYIASFLRSKLQNAQK